jgi:site-specific DNA-cytosine methylase
LAKARQPAIVILENVAKCPAKEMEEAFKKAGYVAAHCKVCTSDYLLPQSRQRKYFFFIHRDKAQQTPGTDWVELMEKLGSKRPALPTDKALDWKDFLRNDSAAPSQNKKRKRGGGKPLSASQGTKWLAEVKAIEKKEGLTPYDEDGGRPYSEVTSNSEALVSLPDRAKLRLDVQYKRAVKAGIDPTVTPLLWNPAQQLRFTDARPWLRTIAPCVTPKHEWIVSSRKGPLNGRECLDLQGIPVSDDDIASFDDAQLRDLAGNAMSTTPIAAACLAAFLSCEMTIL